MQETATAREVTIPLSAEAMAAVMRALAEPRRLAILQQIAAGDSLLCASLEVHDCLSPATISHHLKELQMAGLIQAEREGRAVRLSLRRQVWNAYLQQLTQLL